jgi:hypothetical protein
MERARTPRELAERHNTSTGHLANLRSQSRGVPYVRFSSRRVGYGKHGANGHANFGPGDVALVLGSIERTTGELRPNQNVGRAISTAVRYGWLAKGSKARCLIVPPHAVESGLGNP